MKVFQYGYLIGTFACLARKKSILPRKTKLWDCCPRNIQRQTSIYTSPKQKSAWGTPQKTTTCWEKKLSSLQTKNIFSLKILSSACIVKITHINILASQDAFISHFWVNFFPEDVNFVSINLTEYTTWAEATLYYGRKEFSLRLSTKQFCQEEWEWPEGMFVCEK